MSIYKTKINNSPLVILFKYLWKKIASKYKNYAYPLNNIYFLDKHCYYSDEMRKLVVKWVNCIHL